MSTFGKILKFDSTKKICKKLSGEGQGTVEWCTNVGNQDSQVLTCVLTSEESLTMLQPMATGLMQRYKKAGVEPPLVMYVDRGCCHATSSSAIEKLFEDWTDSGMIIRLDIFHWIHRFDAAVRTDHHSKYALFKSALSAAVFAYNKDDMALLAKAIQAGFDKTLDHLSDAQVIKTYASREDLKHFVRQITVGAQETFSRVQSAIDSLKGTAGLDENGIHLFKDGAAIDETWAMQQKHLQCIQDPPGIDLYTTVKTVRRNGVSLPYYRTVRGSSSLEGFHSFLPNMIPGPRCVAVPFQVYLLSGIARWNADRDSAAVKGRKGREHRVYNTPLFHRLNKVGKELFDKVEEVNFRTPVPPGDELIGLEYLFSQSHDSFNSKHHYKATVETLTTTDESDAAADVVSSMDDEEEEDGQDQGYMSETDAPLPTSTKLVTTSQEVCTDQDPCAEDVSGPWMMKRKKMAKIKGTCQRLMPLFLPVPNLSQHRKRSLLIKTLVLKMCLGHAIFLAISMLRPSAESSSKLL